ncbi:hypothetical protein INT43_005762, partial [Umbelopsis isabellina]
TGAPATSVFSTNDGARILCVADVRGCISQLNQLAEKANAQYIVHTGDFGFYEHTSLERISDRTLNHLLQYSTLIPPQIKSRLNNAPTEQLRRSIEQTPGYLSEFPEFLSGKKKLNVPVYTVWGACEDVAVLEKFRSKEYSIPNLHILDEAKSHLLEIGGVSLRLFGLGGAVVQHKLFDNGEGLDTIAGGSGTMWTTALQIGELVETAQNVYDPSETRVLVTHASPGREGLLAQLALVLRVDFTISAGLHFRYGISYNEFACQPDQEHFRNRLVESQQSFLQLWDSIRDQVENYVDDTQNALLQNALSVVNRLPPSLHDRDDTSSSGFSDLEEQGFKNTWNFNLPDAAFGWVILDLEHGRVSAETKSQGFNFAYRKNNVYPTSSNASSQKAHSVASSEHSIHEHEGRMREHSQNSEDNASSNADSVSSRSNRRQSLYKNPYVAYVGGLSNTTVTEEEIKVFFGTNSVTAVKFPLDHNTQLPKPHCYVDFIDQAALDEALAKNGQLWQDNKLIINKPNPHIYDGRGRGRGQRGGRGNRTSRLSFDRVQ